MKVGEYKIIPANFVIWSTTLQRNIKFTEDTVVKITNVGTSNIKNYFADIQTAIGGEYVTHPNSTISIITEIPLADAPKLESSIFDFNY